MLVYTPIDETSGPGSNPTVLISPDDAQRQISSRIDKGNGLSGTNRHSFQLMAAMRREYDQWNGYNVEMLSRMFSTQEYASEYDRYGELPALVPPPPSSPSELHELHRLIGAKVSYLESVIERLELMPVSPTVRSHSPVLTGNPMMTNDDILAELKQSYSQRSGMSDEEGRCWLARVQALVGKVDPRRAGTIEDQLPIFSMPGSVDMRRTAWGQVQQVVEDVIAKLEVGGYMSEEARPGAREQRVFIGHGRSNVWIALRDLLKDRLGIEYEEFNRVSPAGYSHKERIEAMLDSSSFAFVVMTGEDLDTEERLHARENVIHEAGLFQGRHGFTRAIILLEEGCTVFSNIQGLGQIRFPKGNIMAVSEDIRRVLEREGLLPPS